MTKINLLVAFNFLHLVHSFKVHVWIEFAVVLCLQAVDIFFNVIVGNKSHDAPTPSGSSQLKRFLNEQIF